MLESFNRKSYPRATLLQATERLAELSGVDVAEVTELASPNFDGMRFHHTPEQIVTEQELGSLRGKVVELASKYGFPLARMKLDGQSSNQFDRDLAKILVEEMQIIPAEAADDEVWWFITLFLLPDVSVWRFPLPSEATASNPATWHVRFMDRRRGLFRQAWWRNYLLGNEICSHLNEDEFLNLVDRGALSGFRPLANAISLEFISRLNSDVYKGGARRSIFRKAMIQARRALGHVAVHAMNDEQLRKFAFEIFDEAELGINVGTSNENEEDSSNEFEGSLAQFLMELGDISKLLTPFISKPDLSEKMILDLRSMLPIYSRLHPGDDQVARISQDLDYLLLAIHDLDRERQLIIYAATAYFLLADDAVPDSQPGGFDDDELVLETAFSFLKIPRPSSNQ